jgi:hypothetical protein
MNVDFVYLGTLVGLFLVTLGLAWGVDRLGEKP